MISGLLKKCPEPGCPELVSTGRCVAHEKSNDRLRGSSTERGYDSRWRKMSEMWRRGWNPDGKHHPEQLFCANPFGDHSELKKAECVDHIIPHKGDMVAFWNYSLWRSLCLPCNTKAEAIRNSAKPANLSGIRRNLT